MIDIKVETLVKQYKKEQTQTILDQIFKELKSLIIKKSRYIYERKYFPIALYHLCKSCRNCEVGKELIKEEKKKVYCELCKDCRCVKGYFNLKKNNLCDYQDVENDLWLEILRVIRDYDITKNFATYLISSIYEWRPAFLTKDFVTSLRNISLTKTNSEGSEEEMDFENDESENQIFSRLTMEEIRGVAKTKKEKELLSILLNQKGIDQKEIAKKLHSSRQTVSKIFKRLQLRLKNKFNIF